MRRAALLLPMLLAACDLTGGPQSALDPAGPAARRLAELFWVMAAGGALIWVAVVAIAIYAVRIRPGVHSERTGYALLLVGGVAFPVVVLAALLVYGLGVMSDLRTPPERADILRIHVSGEQWWWRVHYYPPGATEPVVSANEIVMPTDRPVAFTLTSPDVIHSFWIPSLGGKLDMIPGRLNRFTLTADTPGIMRGECAEFCGTSHALMAFTVRALPEADFDTWLATEAKPAALPQDPASLAAQATFMEAGCAACHTIRGTEADGRIGPDLTHLGGRATIAAGILPNNAGTIAGWIADTQSIKPGNKMPPYDGLSGRELRQLGTWLAGLGRATP